MKGTKKKCKPWCVWKGESTRCSLRGVSAMRTPLVQLLHTVHLRGAGSGVPHSA
jgi:hypothetical protein